MTTVELLSPAGYGEYQREHYHYAQVLRIGERVEISGQGGWTVGDGFPYPAGRSLSQEYRQAFDNVAWALASAGASWGDVVHVNSYHVPVDGSIVEGVQLTSALFKEFMPEQPPIWTCIGVTGLGAGPLMRVEIRAPAILGGRPPALTNEGFGTILRDQFHYGQAVRLVSGSGARVEISGQGGWNDAFEFPPTLEAEYSQSFANIGTVLALAGATWRDVVHVNSYHKVSAGDGGVVTGNAAAHWMLDGFGRYMPDHQPIWTCIGTPALGDERMNVEIRVSALLSADTSAELLVTPGTGEILHREHAMSQIVRHGRRIEISGQGGWDDHFECPPDPRAQHRQAMVNVGRTLAAAGASWRDVVQVHSYHVASAEDGSIGSEALLTAELFAEFMPHHAPIWTCIGVPALGDASMKVEIRVIAYLPA